MKLKTIVVDRLGACRTRLRLVISPVDLRFSIRFALVFASLGVIGGAHGAEPLEAFLTEHCIRCHGPDDEEGELRIDLLSRDFERGGETHRWAELIERVNSGEMPPEEEPQPTQDEIAMFVARL